MEKGKKKSNLMVFILIALASALSVFSIQTFLHNRSLVGEIKSMNEKLESLHLISTSKDALSVNREVLNLQFKEDFYLNQLNNSTTIILGSIGFVLALGGFLTFKSIDERLVLMEQKAEEKSDEIRNVVSLTSERLDKNIESLTHEILDFVPKFRDVEAKFENTNEKILENHIKTEELCGKILSESLSYSQAIKNHVFALQRFSMIEKSKDFDDDVFNTTITFINSYLLLCLIDLRKKNDEQSNFYYVSLKPVVEKLIFQIESKFESKFKMFSTYTFFTTYLHSTRDFYEELLQYKDFDYLERLLEVLEDKMKFNKY